MKQNLPAEMQVRKNQEEFASGAWREFKIHLTTKQSRLSDLNRFCY